MKKLLLMLPILAITGIASAQTEGFSKGSIFASGNVGFSSQKEPAGTDDDKTTSFTFNPRIGYFITSNIALGVNLGISSSKFTDNDSEDKYTMTTFGAFGRYYFTPANKFSMFLNLGFDYQSSKNVFKQDGVPDDVESKENGFGIGLAPGFNYFISKRLALESSIGILGFSSMKPDVDGAKATTNFSLFGGMSDISVGLVFKLN
ncbi:MAG TPA: outer membrane beta-barrel protein [Ferruginibacter sp.]|nr:outer membrane beta-barrel protein [Ferruginibacter sp.]HRO07105.1 outer membrane beta-barrel protein [Ferruginibacter sp.]